jgi:hypothetical protein
MASVAMKLPPSTHVTMNMETTPINTAQAARALTARLLPYVTSLVAFAP